MTAGNSSGINDGAAALVVTTEEKAQALGRKPLARIVSYCTIGVDPMIMGMGPVEAMRKAAERAKVSLADLDLVELNQPSRRVIAGTNRSRESACGGAVALGHRLARSGARILTTLVHALQARGGRGAASLGGSMGAA